MSRVIAIFLEGLDFDFAKSLVKEGEMPNFAAVGSDGIQYELEHGEQAVRTGLCAEHVATGLAPKTLDSYCITRFDPKHYDFYGEYTTSSPIQAKMRTNNVVFDLAYFRMEDVPDVRGLTGWGSHDVGCNPGSHPMSLRNEIAEKFGEYKGKEFLYGFVWPSVSETRAMGDALKAAVLQRANVCEWLLSEKFTDWDYAHIAVSEPHSGVEGLYHGINESHPRNDHPSAAVAKKGMIGIYKACDALVGQLRDKFPDAKIIAYAMHGMGANDSDVTAMALLPELLYRREFGEAFIDTKACFSTDPTTGYAIPAVKGNWEQSFRKGLRDTSIFSRYKLRFLRRGQRKRINKINTAVNDVKSGTANIENLDWMPGSLYRAHWPKMRAFGLPSFTDGHIRLNVEGRERNGRISQAEYSSEIDNIVKFLEGVTNPETGLPIAQGFEINQDRDPMAVGSQIADIRVVWTKGQHVTSFYHPELGQVGPFPTRRVGGHTGRNGMALIDLRGAMMDDIPFQVADGEGLFDGQKVVLSSSFDVAPTIAKLLGESVECDGRALF